MNMKTFLFLSMAMDIEGSNFRCLKGTKSSQPPFTNLIKINLVLASLNMTIKCSEEYSQSDFPDKLPHTKIY